MKASWKKCLEGWTDLLTVMIILTMSHLLVDLGSVLSLPLLCKFTKWRDGKWGGHVKWWKPWSTRQASAVIPCPLPQAPRALGISISICPPPPG